MPKLQRLRRSGTLRLPAAIGVGLLLLAITGLLVADWYPALPADSKKTFIGTTACLQCHQEQGKHWTGSHHDLAMDLATDETVRGDFGDQQITHHGITTRLFRDGQRYMVHTEGPDGEMADFEVKYVFGYEPLQQYMVEIQPASETGAIGRVQVLRVSWDTQRETWFYLNPPDVNEKLHPDDPLHWTGTAQNWNQMCAECHSTNLQKGFSIESDSYATTFTDIDVGCEACHGPGSLHAQIADSKRLFWDRRHGKGMISLADLDAHGSVDTCAPCHSRRAHVFPDFVAGDDYFDHYSPQLLSPTTYYPDGQILDEVYVFGSFIQSKMYHKDIRCTDCHDPHSNRLKYNDNRLCTSCHQHNQAKYDAPGHHHHPVGSKGASCVECHMPATDYMHVDFRRDHSFKVPRPDLSQRLGTPNACTGCHLNDANMGAEKRASLPHYSDCLQAARDGDDDVAAALKRLDGWAARTCQSWYGKHSADRKSEFATEFQDAWEMKPHSSQALGRLARDMTLPGMIRASALSWLERYPPSDGIASARKAMKDRDPQVRAAAVRYLGRLAPSQAASSIIPLLTDESRIVRIPAALALAGGPTAVLTSAQRSAMEQSLKEYRTMLHDDGDTIQAHVNLALLAEKLGDMPSAESSYRNAIRLHPHVAGPRSNLAALVERVGRTDDANELRKQELPLLARDAKLAPNNANVQYQVGLAYFLDNQLNKSESFLRRAVKLQPHVSEYSLTLSLFYRKQRRYDEALEQIEQLRANEPTNGMFLQLQREIQAERAQTRPSAPASKSSP